MLEKSTLYRFKYICIFIICTFILVVLTSCEPSKECTDIRLKIESEGYLNGWKYVKNIDSLDGENSPSGRILFALYENESNSGEYAVLKIAKLTVPNRYNGSFVDVQYNAGNNTAEKIDKKSEQLIFGIEYKDSTIDISVSTPEQSDY